MMFEEWNDLFSALTAEGPLFRCLHGEAKKFPNLMIDLGDALSAMVASRICASIVQRSKYRSVIHA